MKKYIKPEMCVCNFDTLDIITESAAQPQDIRDYKPADGSPSFAAMAYVSDWNIMD